MRILVVDDMAAMRHVMINMLRRIGWEQIDEARDGDHALELLKRKQYGLVISDLHMPKVDGLQLLKSIRQDNKLKNTPLLMVTCENGKKQVQEALLGKVNGFILKPFNLKTLELHLSRAISAIQ